MAPENFNAEIDAFIEESWKNCVADIGKLVRIPSVEDASGARAGAPFGAQVRAALDEALDIAGVLGFKTADIDGYVGVAEMPGQTTSTLGIIGHVDVVPAGNGWDFEPFALSRHDGHLVGRGVADDKGPLMCALYALKFWKDAGARFPNTVRVIFGCNEETRMADVAYYRTHQPDPDFLFTPDAQFPVCYGEKGIYQGSFTSGTLAGGRLVEISGGSATNAVPGSAFAILDLGGEGAAVCSALPQACGIEARAEAGGAGRVKIVASGKSAHASTPDEGVSAINILVDYLLDNNLLSAAEAAYFSQVKRIVCATDGSGVGLADADADFGPLTLVGGTIKLEDATAAEGPSPENSEGRACTVTQTFDIRFPTTVSAQQIQEVFEAMAASVGGRAETIKLQPPFLTRADTPQIQALVDAFDQVTGMHKEPFTMGGGTYAREFPRAASFGPEMPWVELPEWAGAMHGPNEAISEDQLKTAIKIYALAIHNLATMPL